VRYAFGIKDGTYLVVRRISALGVVNSLQTVAWNVSEAEIRIRRDGDSLSFEQRVDEVWTSRHVASLPAGGETTRVGMFLATDTAQSVKIAFEEAILVHPGDTP